MTVCVLRAILDVDGDNGGDYGGDCGVVSQQSHGSESSLVWCDQSDWA